MQLDNLDSKLCRYAHMFVAILLIWGFMNTSIKKCMRAMIMIPFLINFGSFMPEVLAEQTVNSERNCPRWQDGESGMFKVVALVKRRSGMSVEEFRSYYETQHAPLALSYMPKLCRYFRRFVDRQVDAATGEVTEPGYDSVSEFWFASRKDYEETMQQLATPEIKAVMDEDETKLFDRTKMIILEVDEFESVIP